MRAREFIIENEAGHLSSRQQNPTVGLHTYDDGGTWASDYSLYRLGLAVAATNGENEPLVDKASWIGKRKSTHPYTKQEVEMLKKAYKAIEVEYTDLNHGNLHSEELKSTNKISPVAQIKKNKYGV
jgi:hypothetical protein